MKKYINGQYIEMTSEEIAEMQKDIPSIPYEQRVVSRIREKYSADDEYALHRKAFMALHNGEPLSDEFVEYNKFVEAIKTEEKWKM